MFQTVDHLKVILAWQHKKNENRYTVVLFLNADFKLF